MVSRSLSLRLEQLAQQAYVATVERETLNEDGAVL